MGSEKNRGVIESSFHMSDSNSNAGSTFGSLSTTGITLRPNTSSQTNLHKTKVSLGTLNQTGKFIKKIKIKAINQKNEDKYMFKDRSGFSVVNLMW